MIDERAVVDPGAEIGEGVSIGPFSVVESGVRIGDRTRIGSHVVIRSNTTIGADNRIYQFSSIGEEAQYLGIRRIRHQTAPSLVRQATA